MSTKIEKINYDEYIIVENQSMTDWNMNPKDLKFKYQYYYPDGNIKRLVFFDKDLKTKRALFDYDENGVLENETIYYYDGTRLSETDYYKNGNKQRHTVFSNTQNRLSEILYWENGEKKREGDYYTDSSKRFITDYFIDGRKKSYYEYTLDGDVNDESRT